MTCDSIVNVTEARRQLSKLIDRQSFAISRHGKVVGIFLSRDRIERLIESLELQNSSEFAKAVKDYESGRMKFYTAAKLDKAMSK